VFKFEGKSESEGKKKVGVRATEGSREIADDNSRR
jgi:hypothetical protein